jgi:translation initiation factor IF-1
MHKKELIVLDATLKNVISNSAFRAVLGNGHEIVAYARGAEKAKAAQLALGDSVRVEMSPYDMSKGRISFA